MTLIQYSDCPPDVANGLFIIGVSSFSFGDLWFFVKASLLATTPAAMVFAWLPLFALGMVATRSLSTSLPAPSTSTLVRRWDDWSFAAVNGFASYVANIKFRLYKISVGRADSMKSRKSAFVPSAVAALRDLDIMQGGG